jgi:tetratricopeptide (TPR) repeat protein
MDVGRDSRARLIVLCVVVVLLVCAVGYGFDRMLGREGVTRTDILLTSNGLTGLVAGLLFYTLTNVERQRRKLVRERLSTISEMNHHIRNALQVITYATATGNHDESVELIRTSVERIEWALREVLPGFPYNSKVSFRFLPFALLCFCLCIGGVALSQDATKPPDSSPPQDSSQDSPQDSSQDSPAPPVERVHTDKSTPPPKDNAKLPPRTDNIPADESSSKQTQIDVQPPSDDAKSHPEADLGSNDVDEFTPYNPMKAMKAVEVGDFYFKRENYSAAISRYREALEYKPHDAEATFRLAQVLQKTGDTAGATENYQDYLKILPDGPYAKKSHEELDKLKKHAESSQAKK